MAWKGGFGEWDSVPEKTDDDLARFNLGIASTRRIDSLLISVEHHLSNGNLKPARMCLESVYNEIDFLLTDDERNELDTLKPEMDEILHNKNIDEISFNGYRYPKERQYVFSLLTKFNRLLRRFMYKHGLSMPQASESALF